ncbi:hypothetical protein SLEP1_g39721 [Rubroshorea leprosula]|uniref:NADH dehydrogenase subunit 1 n=1 Tax=Rubroshorea leprosula TaxID=152421 RepID=A0AAV5L142_9ROSI|nr:hypothetical protein SLEP1_g39721 [Rubroshorea leprosula]
MVLLLINWYCLPTYLPGDCDSHFFCLPSLVPWQSHWS